jgi:hypothetical protein
VTVGGFDLFLLELSHLVGFFISQRFLLFSFGDSLLLPVAESFRLGVIV